MSTGDSALQEDSPVSISRKAPIAVIPITPFGKYTLMGKLGHGGMAEVFLGYAAGPAGFRKLCVIKRLHPNLEEEPGFVDMFLDEARLAARLSHPNVVQTYEVGDVDGSHFIAMEYLEGQGLDRIRQRCYRAGKKLSPPEAARVVSEALTGLQYAHELRDFDGTELNVIHRDISPQNVFVTYEGGVKLLDFGIAKAASHVVETRTGVIKGKFAYIAPEQARAGMIDRRADIWSMGVVFWEVLAGTRLFKGPNDVATLNESLTKDIPPLSEFVPDVPESLQRICSKALIRDPDKRYQTALEMKNELRQYLVTEGGNVAREDVATFVQGLFGDVIQQTRRVLKTCLSDAKSERGLTTDEYRYLIESSEDIVDASTPSGIRQAPFHSPPPLFGSGMTPSQPSGTVLTPQSNTEETKSRTKMMLILLLLLLPLGIGIGWALSQRETPSVEVAGPSSEPAPPPREPLVHASAIVSLTSTPSGAEVIFGNRSLGRTPLERELGRLPEGAEATFVFRLEGRLDVIVSSPIREDRVDVHADLGGVEPPEPETPPATEPDQTPPPEVVRTERPRQPVRPHAPPPGQGELNPGETPQTPRATGDARPPGADQNATPDRPRVIIDEGQPSGSVPIID
jgi:serine/threonine-protein kinase